VTNTGDIDLKHIHVTDANLGIDTYIDVDAGKTSNIDAAGTWGEGTQTNTVDVTASFTDDCGNAATEGMTGTDTATYFGAKTALDISKVIICDCDEEAEALPAGAQLLSGPVHYRIVVHNTGNVDLTGISISDAGTSASTSDDQTWTIDLAAGAFKTIDYTLTWAKDLQVNDAHASYSFEDDGGHTFTSNPDAPNLNASASYFGAFTGIKIDKITIDNTLGIKGDVLWVNTGDNLSWQYTVTNTGNVALDHVQVTDDKLLVNPTLQAANLIDGTGDLNGNGVLDTDETWIFTATGTAVKGTYTNTGTVTGDFTDACGITDDAQSTDTAGYVTTATVGLSKGYWANHSWDGALGTDNCIILGDGNLSKTANDGYDLTFDRAGALQMDNSNATGDARIILGGQLVAAQLNAYQAKVDPTGLLELGAKWFVTYGGQDVGNVKNPSATAPHAGTGGVSNQLETVGDKEWVVDKKNGFTFYEGDAVSTTGAAWKGAFYTTSTLDNPATTGVHEEVAVTGEGLKNLLMAYDHGLGNSNGLVVSSDGSLVGWQYNNTVEFVYANTSIDNVIHSVMDAIDANHVGIQLAGISHVTV
jgi:hypothetical protein